MTDMSFHMNPSINTTCFLNQIEGAFSTLVNVVKCFPVHHQEEIVDPHLQDGQSRIQHRAEHLLHEAIDEVVDEKTTARSCDG